MRLVGKTAIVTGDGSGFGAGVARKFIVEGAQVVIADINLAATESLSNERGTSAHAAHVDVADLGSVSALATQAEKSVSAVDIMINNAGVILNIASTAGVSPRPNLNWYNSSKGWMNTATKTMAVELAPFGIRVNAINPVAGETPLLASFMGEDTPEVRAKFLSTIPLGRFSMPEDIANSACYLCSGEASMVTGVRMEVDGGRCI